MRLRISMKARVRPSVCLSVCRKTNMAIFGVKKSSNDIIINGSMSDSEKSHLMFPWCLFKLFFHSRSFNFIDTLRFPSFVMLHPTKTSSCFQFCLLSSVFNKRHWRVSPAAMFVCSFLQNLGCESVRQLNATSHLI